MRRTAHLTVWAAALLLLGATASAQTRTTKEEYIRRFKALAEEHQEIYGIPASIKLAQGLLESDSGNSRLAREANNHFGIKCKRDWTGETITHDDDARGECFRKYDSAEDSWLDHSEFLDKSPRYQGLFELDPSDYKGWAYGLKAAGYATNPRYAELLIKMIEDNRLFLIDEGRNWSADAVTTPKQEIVTSDIVIGDKNVPKVDVDNYMVAMHQIGGYSIYYNNGSEFIIARSGDTYESIASAVGIGAAKLRKFNDSAEGEQPAGGEMVYIKKKASRSNNGKLMHLVKEDETLRSIAQSYGIRMDKLAKINRRTAHSKVLEGEMLRLQ
ncbi:MAG: glucosaminidase domain-containing protein [Rikenellaceae bacterium]|nr:glucosaminidase domain-containing protein [Rikenellaceae bacterium]